MKLRYEASRGRRINYGTFWVTTFDKWWYQGGEWVRSDDVDDTKCRSSHSDCLRSVKAFRRMLKSAPNGVEFILVSRWRGHEVYGKGSAPITLPPSGPTNKDT